MPFEDVIDKQIQIANGVAASVPLPRFQKYTMCNLRGGIGKTTLSFNISHLADDLLVVDTCPQGNLSYCYDNQYYSSRATTVCDLILSHLIPNVPGVTHTIINHENIN